MKYALAEGDKIVAMKGRKGSCPCCGSDLIPKCGDLKVHHWSHKGSRNCDQWWENETEWHRCWKDKFPKEWQEVVQFDQDNEKHIADVKTGNGWTLEFQYSFLNSEERQSRNDFYEKLIWVVNGSRRKTDRAQFRRMLESSSKLRTSIPIIKAHFPDECRLLKEWRGNSLVFFDFSENDEYEDTKLWFLFPQTSAGSVYLSPFSRSSFIDIFRNDGFDELLNNVVLPIYKEIDVGERKQKLVASGRSKSISGFDGYMTRQKRRNRRL